MLVCRGCCCGTTEKHPGIDHAAHLATLRAAAFAGSGKLWTVDCLGTCERSNVIAVRSGGRRRWFGEVLSDVAIATLAAWIAGGGVDEPPASMSGAEFVPDDSPLITAVPTGYTADEIAGLIASVVAGGAGSWSFGVHGAVAEFDGCDAERVVSRLGRVIESRTSTASMRITVGDDTRMFSLNKPGTDEPFAFVLGVPESSVVGGRTSLTNVGPDLQAMLPEGRHGTLFDLGLGSRAASFCVRGDNAISRFLDPHTGAQWFDVADILGPQLVAASPHRVITTSIGRVEIYTPIPPPDAASPRGSHTHLLPGELDLGLELPPGIGMDPHYVPAAIVNLSPDWLRWRPVHSVARA